MCQYIRAIVIGKLDIRKRQHTAREGQYFSLKLAFLTEMWPANAKSCQSLLYINNEL
jgi:hypothetical protein